MPSTQSASPTARTPPTGLPASLSLPGSLCNFGIWILLFHHSIHHARALPGSSSFALKPTLPPPTHTSPQSVQFQSMKHASNVYMDPLDDLKKFHNIRDIIRSWSPPLLQTAHKPPAAAPRSQVPNHRPLACSRSVQKATLVLLKPSYNIHDIPCSRSPPLLYSAPGTLRPPQQLKYPTIDPSRGPESFTCGPLPF